MSQGLAQRMKELIELASLSEGEREELTALGLLSREGKLQEPPQKLLGREAEAVQRRAITDHSVLNEAYDYGAAFSRGLRVELKNHSILFISGTASVDEEGETIHLGDFGAQCWRTYRNITTLLKSEGASWNDVVKTTCYLRDIERDYDEFNEIRTAFFETQSLDPLPASVGIQARLCRGNLLIEIEAVAILRSQDR